MATGSGTEDPPVEEGTIPLDIDNIQMLLQVEQEQIQKRTFTNWINAQLSKRTPPSVVLDLFSDLRDGTRLLDLLEVMTGQRMKREKGHGVFQHRSNIETALNFLKKKSVKLVNIHIPDIMDGRPSIILGLIWSIILHCHIEELANTLSFSSRQSSLESLASLDSPSSSPAQHRASPLHARFRISAKKALLLWVREQCERAGCTLNIKDFKSSWRSGVAFLAILCSLCPDLVDLSEAANRTNQQNLEEAFRVAEQELHIPRLLEPQDVDIKDPDEKSIMTYVAQFLQYSKDLPVSVEDPQQVTPPSRLSPVFLPSHFTPAVAASPVHQATPSQKVREVTIWLQKTQQELLEVWGSTEGRNYVQRYQAFQMFVVPFDEQRRHVMPMLSSTRGSTHPSEEQRALRQAWDVLAEKVKQCERQLDEGLPAPLDAVGRWLLQVESVLTEEGGDTRDHAHAAQNARDKRGLLKTLMKEMSVHLQTLQTFPNTDEFGDALVPADKLDQIKRRFTSARVTAKYHGIKLEFQECRHSVLDLLAQIDHKLHSWREHYSSQEAVRQRLQDWHETIDKQGLVSKLEEALLRMKVVSSNYTSKSALAEDSQRVTKQLREAESDSAIRTEAVAAARGAMERAVSAWDDYNQGLSSLQAWLGQEASRSPSEGTEVMLEWSARQAHLNEVGNFLIEVTDAETSHVLAAELQALNKQWADYVKRTKFAVISPPAGAPVRPQVVQALTQEATLLMKEPVEVSSTSLCTYRKRLQLLVKKLKEVDLDSLTTSADVSVQSLEKLRYTVREVMQALGRAEQASWELQRSTSALEGRVAELEHWETKAREVYGLLKEGERRGQRGHDPRAKVLISQGLQLEGQLVTEEQDFQVGVETTRKNWPLMTLSVSELQNRVRNALTQSQEAVGMLSSLGSRRIQSPIEVQPPAKIFIQMGEGPHQADPHPQTNRQPQHPTDPQLQQQTDLSPQEHPLPLAQLRPYTYAQAVLHRHSKAAVQPQTHTETSSLTLMHSQAQIQPQSHSEVQAHTPAHTEPPPKPHTYTQTHNTHPPQPYVHTQSRDQHPPQTCIYTQTKDQHSPLPLPYIQTQDQHLLQPQVYTQYPPHVQLREHTSVSPKNQDSARPKDLPQPQPQVQPKLNLHEKASVSPRPQASASPKDLPQAQAQVKPQPCLHEKASAPHKPQASAVCKDVPSTQSQVQPQPWLHDKASAILKPQDSARPKNLPQSQAQVQPQPWLHEQVSASSKPQNSAACKDVPQTQAQVQAPILVSAKIQNLPHAQSLHPTQAYMQVKTLPLVGHHPQASAETHTKAEVLARDRFQRAKNLLQEHVLEAITVYSIKQISEEEAARKEATLQMLDPAVLEEFLRSFESLKPFCSAAQLRDAETLAHSVRTQWEAVRSEIGAFLKHLRFEIERGRFNKAVLRCEMLTCTNPEKPGTDPGPAQEEACLSIGDSVDEAGRRVLALRGLCDTLSPEGTRRLAKVQLRDCERQLQTVQRTFGKTGDTLLSQDRHREEGGTEELHRRDSSEGPVAPQFSQAVVRADSVEVKQTAEYMVIQTVPLEEKSAEQEELERYQASSNAFKAQLDQNQKSLQTEFPPGSVTLSTLRAHLQELQRLKEETERLWFEFELQYSQCSQQEGMGCSMEEHRNALMQQWRGQQICLQRRVKSLGTVVGLVGPVDDEVAAISERLDCLFKKPKEVCAFTLTEAASMQDDIKSLEEGIQNRMDRLSGLDHEEGVVMRDLDPEKRLSLGRVTLCCRRALDELRQRVWRGGVTVRALDRFLTSLRGMERDITGVRAAPPENASAARDCRSRLVGVRRSAREAGDEAVRLDQLMEEARLTLVRSGAPASCQGLVVELVERLEEADALFARQLQESTRQEKASLRERRRALHTVLQEVQGAVESQVLREPTLPALQQRMRALADMQDRLTVQRTELQDLRNVSAQLTPEAGRGRGNSMEELEELWEEAHRTVTEGQEQCCMLTELLKKFQSCRGHLGATLQKAELTLSEQTSYLGKDNLQRLIAKVCGIKEDLAGLSDGVDEIRGVCRQLQSQLRKVPGCPNAPFESEADDLVDRWLDVTEKTDTHMDSLQVGLALWEKLLQLGSDVERWSGEKLAMFAETHPFQSEQEVKALQHEIKAQEENIEHFHRRSCEIQELLQSKEPPLDLQVMESQLRKRMEQVKELFSESHDLFRNFIMVQERVAEKMTACQASLQDIWSSLSTLSVSQTPPPLPQIQELCAQLQLQEEQTEDLLEEVSMLSTMANPPALDSLAAQGLRLKEVIRTTQELIGYKWAQVERGVIEVTGSGEGVEKNSQQGVQVPPAGGEVDSTGVKAEVHPSERKEDLSVQTGASSQITDKPHPAQGSKMDSQRVKKKEPSKTKTKHKADRGRARAKTTESVASLSDPLCSDTQNSETAVTGNTGNESQCMMVVETSAEKTGTMEQVQTPGANVQPAKSTETFHTNTLMKDRPGSQVHGTVVLETGAEIMTNDERNAEIAATPDQQRESPEVAEKVVTIILDTDTMGHHHDGHSENSHFQNPKNMVPIILDTEQQRQVKSSTGPQCNVLLSQDSTDASLTKRHKVKGGHTEKGQHTDSTQSETKTQPELSMSTGTAQNETNAQVEHRVSTYTSQHDTGAQSEHHVSTYTSQHDTGAQSEHHVSTYASQHDTGAQSEHHVSTYASQHDTGAQSEHHVSTYTSQHDTGAQSEHHVSTYASQHDTGAQSEHHVSTETPRPERKAVALILDTNGLYVQTPEAGHPISNDILRIVSSGTQGWAATPKGPDPASAPPTPPRDTTALAETERGTHGRDVGAVRLRETQEEDFPSADLVLPPSTTPVGVLSKREEQVHIPVSKPSKTPWTGTTSPAEQTSTEDSENNGHLGSTSLAQQQGERRKEIPSAGEPMEEAQAGPRRQDVAHGSTMMDTLTEICHLQSQPDSHITEDVPPGGEDGFLDRDLETRLTRMVLRVLGCRHWPAQLEPRAMAQQVEEAEDCRRSIQEQVAALSRVDAAEGRDSEALKHMERQWSAALLEASTIALAKQAQMELISRFDHQMRTVNDFLGRMSAELRALTSGTTESSALQAEKLRDFLQGVVQEKAVVNELLRVYTQVSPCLGEEDRPVALAHVMGLSDRWREQQGDVERALCRALAHVEETAVILLEGRELRAHLQNVRRSLGTSESRRATQRPVTSAELAAANRRYLHLQGLGEAITQSSLGEKEKGDVERSLQEVKEELDLVQMEVSAWLPCFKSAALDRITRAIQDGLVWLKRAEGDLAESKRAGLLPEEERGRAARLRRLQREASANRAALEPLLKELKELVSEPEREDVSAAIATANSLADLIGPTAEALAQAAQEAEAGLRGKEEMWAQISRVEAWVEGYAERETSADSDLDSTTPKPKPSLRQHLDILVEAEKKAAAVQDLLMRSRAIALELSITDSCRLSDMLAGLQEEVQGIVDHEKANCKGLRELLQERASASETLTSIEESLRQISTHLDGFRLPVTPDSLSAMEPLRQRILEHRARLEPLRQCEGDRRRDLLLAATELQRRADALERQAWEHGRFESLMRRVEDLSETMERQVLQAKDENASGADRVRSWQAILARLPLMKRLFQEAADQLRRISPNLNPRGLDSEQQRVRRAMESVAAWEQAASSGVVVPEHVLPAGLRYAAERIALMGLLERAEAELQRLELAAPEERGLRVKLQRCAALRSSMEVGLRVLEALWHREAPGERGPEQGHVALKDQAETVLKQCDLHMERLSQAWGVVRDYRTITRDAAAFLRDAQLKLHPAPDSGGDCSVEELRRALAEVEEGFRAHMTQLQALVPQQGCLSHAEVEQLHSRALGKLLVEQAALQAQGQVQVEALQRCAERRRTCWKCAKEIGQRLKNSETCLSEIITHKATSYTECLDQQAKLGVLAEEVDSLKGALLGALEERRKRCPVPGCGRDVAEALGALWRRWVWLRRLVHCFGVRSERKAAEWKDFKVTVERSTATLDQLETELQDCSGEATSLEELQRMLGRIERCQDRLECESQALAILESRVSRLLAVPTNQDPATPTQLCLELQPWRDRYRNLQEKCILVLEAVRSEVQEREQIQEDVSAVRGRLARTTSLLSGLEQRPSTRTLQEIRTELCSQNAVLQGIVDSVKRKYTEKCVGVPMEIEKPLQEVTRLLKELEGKVEESLEKNSPVHQLNCRVTEVMEGLQGVQALLQQKSASVTEAQTTQKCVWDQLDKWHSCMAVLEGEVQDMWEEQPEQAHLLMDRLMEPLQLYQQVAKQAEQRTAFLSRVPALLQEHEEMIDSSSRWLNEAQSWLDTPCIYTTAKCLSSHAQGLQTILDDSEQMRRSLRDFVPVLQEIGAVCDAAALEEQLVQADQRIASMQQGIMEPLSQLQYTAAEVAAMETEVKMMEKNVTKIRTILSSIDTASITPEEHLRNREVILDNIQSMRRTIAEIQKCESGLGLPKGAGGTLSIFPRAQQLLSTIQELEQLTQEQTTTLKAAIAQSMEQRRTSGRAPEGSTVPSIPLSSLDDLPGPWDMLVSNAKEEEEEEEEEEDRRSSHSSSSGTLTGSVAEDPDETFSGEGYGAGAGALVCSLSKDVFEPLPFPSPMELLRGSRLAGWSERAQSDTGSLKAGSPDPHVQRSSADGTHPMPNGNKGWNPLPPTTRVEDKAVAEGVCTHTQDMGTLSLTPSEEPCGEYTPPEATHMALLSEKTEAMLHETVSLPQSTVSAPLKSVLEPLKHVPAPHKTLTEPLKPISETLNPMSASVKPVTASDETVLAPLQPVPAPLQPVSASNETVSEPHETLDVMKRLKPASAPLKPVSESPKPASAPLKPASEPLKPVSESPKPASEPKTASEPLKPASEPLKVVSTPLKPVSKPPKPVPAPLQPVSASDVTVSESHETMSAPLEPVTESLKPVSEPLKPASTPLKPASASLKPASAPLKPVSEPLKPAPELLKPVSEPLKPAPEPLKPASESPKPVSEPLKPSSESPKPVSESPKPVSESPKSVSAPPKPVSEPLKPASESPKPVSESPKPVSAPLKPVPEPPEAVSAPASVLLMKDVKGIPSIQTSFRETPSSHVKHAEGGADTHLTHTAHPHTYIQDFLLTYERSIGHPAMKPAPPQVKTTVGFQPLESSKPSEVNRSTTRHTPSKVAGETTQEVLSSCQGQVVQVEDWLESVRQQLEGPSLATATRDDIQQQLRTWQDMVQHMERKLARLAAVGPLEAEALSSRLGLLKTNLLTFQQLLQKKWREEESGECPVETGLTRGMSVNQPSSTGELIQQDYLPQQRELECDLKEQRNLALGILHLTSRTRLRHSSHETQTQPGTHTDACAVSEEPVEGAEAQGETAAELRALEEAVRHGLKEEAAPFQAELRLPESQGSALTEGDISQQEGLTGLEVMYGNPWSSMVDLGQEAGESLDLRQGYEGLLQGLAGLVEQGRKRLVHSQGLHLRNRADLQTLLSRHKKHFHDLSSLLAVVRRLSQRVPGADLRRLEEVEREVGALQLQAVEEGAQLQRTLEAWARWEDSSDRLGALLQDVDARLPGVGPAEESGDQLRERLEAYQRAEELLERSKAQLHQALDLGRGLHSGGRCGGVSVALQVLEARWLDVRKRVEQERLCIEACGNRWSRFQRDSVALSKWMDKAKDCLKTWRELSVAPLQEQGDLRGHLAQLLEFTKEAESMTALKVSVISGGEELLRQRGDDASGLRAQLGRLERGWGDALAALPDLQQRLHQLLMEKLSLGEVVEDLGSWLSRMESVMAEGEETIRRASSTACLDQLLQRHKELNLEVALHQLSLDFLNQSVVRSSSPEDIWEKRDQRTRFAEQLGTLNLRWVTLQGALVNQAHRVEQLQQTCADRESKLQLLRTWVTKETGRMGEFQRSDSLSQAQRQLRASQDTEEKLKVKSSELQELREACQSGQQENDCTFTAQLDAICADFTALSQQIAAVRPGQLRAVELWEQFEEELARFGLETVKIRHTLEFSRTPHLSLQALQDHTHKLQALQDRGGKGKEACEALTQTWSNLKGTVSPTAALLLSERLEEEKARWAEVSQQVTEDLHRALVLLQLWRSYSRLAEGCSQQLRGLREQWGALLSSLSPQDSTVELLQTRMEAINVLQADMEGLQGRLEAVLEASRELIGQMEPQAAVFIQSETHLMSEGLAQLGRVLTTRQKQVEKELNLQKEFHTRLESLDRHVGEFESRLCSTSGPDQTQITKTDLLELSAVTSDLDALKVMQHTVPQNGAMARRLEDLSMKYDLAFSRVTERYSELQTEALQQQSFEQKCESWIDFLRSVEASLAKGDVTGSSSSDIREQLAAHQTQRLQVEVSFGCHALCSLISEGLDILDRRKVEDRCDFIQKLAQMVECWRGTVRKVRQRQAVVQGLMGQRQVYARGLRMLRRLLSDADPLLSPTGPAPCTLHQLRQSQEDLKRIEAQLQRHHSSYLRTLETGGRLLSMGGPGMQAQLKAELEDLREAWESTQCILGRRRALMDTALQNWEHCQARLANSREQLEGMKARLKQPLPEPLEELQVTEKLNEETEHLLEEWAHGLKEPAPMKMDLARYIIADDMALLHAQEEELHSQWEELCEKAFLRKQAISDRLSALTVFKVKRMELCDWLTRMEGEVARIADLSTKSMLEKLNEDCTDEMTRFRENKALMERLGEGLIAASGEAKRAEVGGALQDVRDRWQHLSDHIESRVVQLKERLVKEHQLDQRMRSLQAWLSRTEAELAKPLLYKNCTKPEIDWMLAEKEVTHLEVEQQSEGVASVLALCDALLRDTDGCCSDAESASIRETSRSLDLRWRNVCSLSRERRSRIEETWRLWGEFLDEHLRFEDWLRTAEQTAANPNSSDVTYIKAKEELKRFEVLQREVHEQITHLELLNKRYRRMARENRTDTAGGLKARVHETNRRWDSLHGRVASILRRLKYFTVQWEEFEGSREALMVWLTEMDLQLTSMEHLSESEAHDKLKQLTGLQQEIALNGNKIDQLIASGEHLMQRSAATDTMLIEDQLNELHSYRQEVFGRAARFHHRLTHPLPVSEGERDWDESAGADGSWQEEEEEEEEEEMGARGDAAVQQSACDLLTEPPERSASGTPVIEVSAPLDWDHTRDVGGSSSQEDEEDATLFQSPSGTSVTEPPSLLSQEPQEKRHLFQDITESLGPSPPHTSTPCKQGYAKLMSECSGSIDRVKRVSLILDDEGAESPAEQGLTGLTTADKQSGVIQRWEVLQALSPDLQAPRHLRQPTSDLDDITAWLGQVLPELQQLEGPHPPTSIQDMECSVKRLKEMQKDFDRYKAVMISLNLSGQEPCQGEAEVTPGVRNANLAWVEACTRLERWEESLRSALMRCQEFHETLHSLLLWLAHAESRLYAVNVHDPSLEPSSLRKHRDTLTGLEKELQGRQQQVNGLQEISSQLLLEVRDEGGEAGQAAEAGEEGAEAKEKVHVISNKLRLLLRDAARNLRVVQERLEQEVGEQPTENRSVVRRDPSPPRSFFYRVLRAAFPLHLLLLLLLMLACLVPPSETDYSCVLSNNFARSLYPMLHYTNGPPPT